MADVASTLRSWSSTASSNQPQGSTTIGGGLDDNIRQLQATVRQFLADQSATIAPSAGIADLSQATGRWVPVSGSSTVTGFGTESAGIWYLVTLTGSSIITNGNISTPGGVTIVGSAGDMFVADSQGSGVWRIHSYTRSAVEIPYPSVLTAATTVAGTSVSFTSIPAWVKRATVQFKGVQLSGTANFRVQIGDSGGIESSGYLCTGSSGSNGSTLSCTNDTSGFSLPSGSSTALWHGNLVLTLESNPNNWTANGQLGRSDTNGVAWCAGAKALSAGPLTQITVTTSNGTDTFSAGEISVLYE